MGAVQTGEDIVQKSQLEKRAKWMRVTWSCSCGSGAVAQMS